MRINFTMVLTWLLLGVSILIAFVFGWYQWGRYVTALHDREDISIKIALQQEKNKKGKEELDKLEAKISAPNTPKEDPDFVRELKYLSVLSQIEITTITPSQPSALPTIGEANTGKPVPSTAAAASNSSSDAAKKAEEKKQEYSLTTMPLDVHPITVTLGVVGTFAGINDFACQIYNCRFPGGSQKFPPRAINVNSIQINGGDIKGQLRATLMLTRFVTPPANVTPSKQ